MSSIRSRIQNPLQPNAQGFPDPGFNQIGNAGPAYGGGGNAGPVYFGPMLSQGATNAMLALQVTLGAIGQQTSAGVAMGVNDWKCLEGLTKCGRFLADAKRNSRKGGWPNQHNNWQGQQNQALTTKDQAEYNEAQQQVAGNAQQAPQPQYAGVR